MQNEFISAEAIDASSFPHMATAYEVHGVPRTVINETVVIEGAVPEKALLQQVMSAISA